MLRSLLIAALALSAAAPACARDFLRPPALRKGDTIALVAPARSIGEDRLAELTKGLEAMGYRVKPAPNVTKDFGYLAGTDEERATGFMNAWNDPEVDAVFCVTGGYGCTRILDRLDYKAIRRNPKILTGFSDITALHLAISARSQIVTFHSPTSTYAYTNNAQERPIQAKYLWRAIAPEEGVGQPKGYLIPEEPTPRGIAICSGKARGRLVGGNLSLIAATIGTPYEVDTKGAILFIEETNEAPYRVDRMFSQLRLAGKLEEASGVVIGQFNKCEEPDGFTVEELFEQYFGHGEYGYPVMRNFPTGHVIDNATLPVGAMAEMDADAGTIRLLEAPVKR